VRTIDVVTTSRADYGILQPVLRRIQGDPTLRLRVVVSGSHLSPMFGSTVTAIERDGFEIVDRIDVLGPSDTPEETAAAMGRGVTGFGRHWARTRPDLLVVLGDRFEMHAAALAALPFRLPVAHIHGGELTAGAFDDSLRHSMTKLSHLHFVTTEEYARRVRQLGEEPWRVTVAGAPALDHLRTVNLRSRSALEAQFGWSLGETFVLVTFHPTTLESADPARQARLLFDAVEQVGCPAVITMPNADPGGRAVRNVVNERTAANSRWFAVETLGTENYFSVMALASAMVGNSSSGLIEAGSFQLPVVNVGSRQEGRVRGPHVIDVPASSDGVAAGLRRALEPSFRAALAGTPNLYGDGHAAERIVERLKTVPLDDALVNKKFCDWQNVHIECRP
jgi:UDP-hydrolysing UDP-N-acetyl-D-glucosamine 2-epimerase